MESPLTADDKLRINASLKEIDSAEELIAASKRAGLDLGDREARLKEIRSKLQKVKRAFFPNE